MTDFVTYASNRGDIAGRMKRWEQCLCGPEPKDCNNFDEWEKIFNEESKTSFFKTDKTKGLKEVKLSDISPKTKQRLSLKGNKMGIFFSLVALGATAVLGLKDQFSINA